MISVLELPILAQLVRCRGILMDCERLKLPMMQRGHCERRGIGLKGSMTRHLGSGRLRIRLLGRVRVGILGSELSTLCLFDLNLLDWNRLDLHLPGQMKLGLDPPLVFHLSNILTNQLLLKSLPDRMLPLVSWTMRPSLELLVTVETLELRRRYHPSNLPQRYLISVYHPLRKSNRPMTLLLCFQNDDDPRVLIRVDLSLRTQRLARQTTRRLLARTTKTRRMTD